MAGMAAPLVVVPAAAAEEAPEPVHAAATCNGQPRKTIFRKYYRGPLMVPLRCGDKNWGYKHLVAKGRWSKPFDKKIGRTIWSGTITAQGPGQRIFERLQPGCPLRSSFKVVTNPGVYSGDHSINPQGVITAFRPRQSSSAAADC